MAHAFVQENNNFFFGGGTTGTVTMTGVVTGNVLVLGIYWNAAAGATTLNSVTDDKGNTYTLLDNVTNNDAVNGATAYAWNVTGGTVVITATFSNTTWAEGEMWCHEANGFGTSDPLDVHAALAVVSVSAGTDAVTSGAATTTTAGEYIFGVTVSASVPVGGITAGTGFTLRETNQLRGTSENQIQGSSGSIAATFSITNLWVSVVTMMVALKDPAGGAAVDDSGPAIVFSRLRAW